MKTHRTEVLAVLFVNAAGEQVVSRFFSTLRAARSWARWLRSQPFTADVRILRGGPGGETVTA